MQPSSKNLSKIECYFMKTRNTCIQNTFYDDCEIAWEKDVSIVRFFFLLLFFLLRHKILRILMCLTINMNTRSIQEREVKRSTIFRQTNWMWRMYFEIAPQTASNHNGKYTHTNDFYRPIWFIVLTDILFINISTLLHYYHYANMTSWP